MDAETINAWGELGYTAMFVLAVIIIAVILWRYMDKLMNLQSAREESDARITSGIADQTSQLTSAVVNSMSLLKLQTERLDQNSQMVDKLTDAMREMAESIAELSSNTSTAASMHDSHIDNRAEYINEHTTTVVGATESNIVEALSLMEERINMLCVQGNGATIELIEGKLAEMSAHVEQHKCKDV